MVVYEGIQISLYCVSDFLLINLVKRLTNNLVISRIEKSVKIDQNIYVLDLDPRVTIRCWKQM